MGKRNHYRHHAFLISLRNMFLGKASHCRDHSSGVGGWKTGAVIGTTPLRSVYGQKEANIGTTALGSVYGKQDNHRNHSSEGCLWAKGTIIDYIALRNMFMGKANHCNVGF